MRKIIIIGCIGILLNSFILAPRAVANTSYCQTALIGCVSQCGASLFGFFCGVGCAIGYSKCNMS